MIMHTKKYQIPFQIDEEDCKQVSLYTWRVRNRYLATSVGPRGGQSIFKLHWLLLGEPPDGLECDHIDRDKMNNKRENLRFVTKRVNAINRDTGTNTSGVRGVRQVCDKWVAYIHASVGNQICLGRFSTMQEAIDARKAGELRYFGELCK